MQNRSSIAQRLILLHSNIYFRSRATKDQPTKEPVDRLILFDIECSWTTMSLYNLFLSHCFNFFES